MEAEARRSSMTLQQYQQATNEDKNNLNNGFGHYNNNNNHHHRFNPHQNRCNPTSKKRSSSSTSTISLNLSNQHRSCESINNHHQIQSSSNSNTRSAFYSMWNTVKYEFNHRFRNKFNFNSPICVLGQLYYSKMSDSVSLSDEQSSNLYAYDKFKKDFYSRIWLTYRRDFPPLLQTPITTDNGWGCMIRSGQMIMAQAFLTHFHGRNWRWEGQDDLIHRMIIKWFADVPDRSTSPFSIHEIIRQGQLLFGKNPGDWFGPASISIIMKNLLEDAAKDNSLLSDICCLIAQDCTVYLQDVVDLCQNENIPSNSKTILDDDSNDQWRSIIILIPVRLGGDEFNKFYSPYLKQILSLSSCLGIIGGKPRHSLYFVGYQDDKLLAIDPHYCQKSIDVGSRTNFPLESYHCISPRRISLTSIDPSCTIGFYLKTKQDYDEFINFSQQMLDHSYKSGGYPIYSLESNRYEYQMNEPSSSSMDRILRMEYRLVDRHGNVQKLSSEDFVVL
ncbi:Cysteine protease atg4c [Dermatophagoides pteronyssinus]|uniref:Cysteine protease n=1 Tax=Dermatophagoides pteronyssinus TaxID=6956 RepID=A0ABQ8J9B3_DERPT|nr:Cysteine protease atg4c [Dermatophagoides pteronyssinus]